MSIPGGDQCEALLMWAKHVYNQNNVNHLNPPFETTFDRLIIREGSRQGLDYVTCYNLPKIGKYGICAVHGSHPNAWGFCTKNCHLLLLDDEQKVAVALRQYRELNGKYFENVVDWSMVDAHAPGKDIN